MGASALSREGAAGLSGLVVSPVLSSWQPREDPTVQKRAQIEPSFVVQESCFETSARWGVWLGRHICYTTTQVS